MPDYDAILNKLDIQQEHKCHIAIDKANEEIRTINREHTAYYDGAYDAIKAIKEAKLCQN